MKSHAFDGYSTGLWNHKWVLDKDKQIGEIRTKTKNKYFVFAKTRCGQV